MAVRAYMLVATNLDPADFVREARKIPGVVAADALFGALDALVVMEGKDLAELEEIAGRVHRTPGLKSGDTRIARSG